MMFPTHDTPITSIPATSYTSAKIVAVPVHMDGVLVRVGIYTVM